MSPNVKFRRLAAALLAVTVLALGLYWWRVAASTDALRADATRQHELAARRLALAAALQSEALMRAVDATLVQLRTDWLEHRENFAAGVRVAIANLPPGAVLQIGVIDAEGLLVASSLGDPGLIHLSDREYFRLHAEGRHGDRLHVSAPVVGRRSGVWSIQLTRRMERGGRFAGVIFASLSPEHVADQFARFEPAAGDVLALFRQDGSYLARVPRLNDFLGLSTHSGRPFLGPDAPPHGNLRSRSTHEPVERFYAWHRLGDLPLVVVAGLDVSGLMQPIEDDIRRTLLRNALGSLLILLLAAGTAWLLLRAGRQQQELADAADLYRSLFEKNTSVKLLIDPEDGRIVDANTAACRFYGYARHDLLAKRIHDINALPPAEVEAEMALAREEKRQYFNFRHRLASGEIRDVEVYSGPVHIGRRVVLHSIIHDVTERHRLEESLRISQSVFEATTEGILVTDADGIIVSVNPAFCRITGFSADDAVGKPAHILSSGQHDRAFFEDMFATLARDGYWEGDITNRHRDGALYVSGMKITAMRDGDGHIVRYLSLLCDVTLKKRREEEIWHCANYDALTDLPNRILFHDRLRQAIIQAQRHAGRVAMMFLDLDHFKAVNDTYGHPAGDALLRQVAIRIADCVRSEDTVARVGGDEFLVLLPNIQEQEAARSVADKILAALALPFELTGGTARHRVTIGACIGIAVYPDDASTLEDLLALADRAMYRAKDEGRGAVREAGDDPHARIAAPNPAAPPAAAQPPIQPAATENP